MLRHLRLRAAGCLSPRRRVHTASPRRDRLISTETLLSILLQNPELDLEDAQNELRWIRDDVRAGPSSGGSRLKPDQADQAVWEMVERRSRGEPLQYILGSTNFGPLTIKCRAPILIPRPETSHVFGMLAERLASVPLQQSSVSKAAPVAALNILDLCCGSGCISLLLRHQLGARLGGVLGLDISPDAVQLARENAAALGLDVQYDEADIFVPLIGSDVVRLVGGRVGVVVSNPPYIPRIEWEDLPRSVKEYEDPRALQGDPAPRGANQAGALARGIAGSSSDAERFGRGLAFYERISQLLPDILATEAQMAGGGWGGIPRVVLEVGHDQAREVRGILQGRERGIISRTEVWLDQFGTERAVVGFTS